jgi:deoxyxylulose-5-phosphate synthase
MPERGEVLEIGKGRVVYTTPASSPTSEAVPSSPSLHGSSVQSMDHTHKACDDDTDNTIALLSYGARLGECLKAAEMLEANGHSVTVADARFAKPLDEDLIRKLSTEHRTLITIEEGSIGGFGSFVLEFMNREGLLQNCRVHTMHLPDTFQDHDTPEKQYEEARLVAEKIVSTSLQRTK